jgi:hypothetical protein
LGSFTKLSMGSILCYRSEFVSQVLPRDMSVRDELMD